MLERGVAPAAVVAGNGVVGRAEVGGGDDDDGCRMKERRGEIWYTVPMEGEVQMSNVP